MEPPALNYKATDDTAFRAPTLAERFVTQAMIFNGIPNPDLNKEAMTTYEIGMFKQLSSKVSFDIAGFLDNYNNLIQSTTIHTRTGCQ